MKEWFMVAVGGMLGSLLRHGANQLATHSFGEKFPLGTLVANVLGCFLIGLGGPWQLAMAGSAGHGKLPIGWGFWEA